MEIGVSILKSMISRLSVADGGVGLQKSSIFSVSHATVIHKFDTGFFQSSHDFVLNGRRTG
jgi:hypothetical protein